MGGWGGGGCFPCQQPSLSGPGAWLPYQAGAGIAISLQRSPGTAPSRDTGELLTAAFASPGLRFHRAWSGTGLGPMRKIAGHTVTYGYTWSPGFQLPWWRGQTPLSPDPCICHCLHKPATPHHWCPEHPTAPARSRKSLGAFTGKFKWCFSVVENTSRTTAPRILHRPPTASVSNKPQNLGLSLKRFS